MLASKTNYGVSFSIKAAREMDLDPKACLKSSLKDLGVRRLRLMSYWDEHEKIQGVYDFTELDWQLELAGKYGAEITLCLGLKQPRWPESHWPEWAKESPKDEWQTHLMNYMKTVVNRYKTNKNVVSWQLENEARLKSFGLQGNFDRKRLINEFKLVKELDSRPLIMSTSDSFGLPVFGPTPDEYGFSIYRYFFRNGRYRHAHRAALFYKIRAALITLLTRRPVFIHELQAEPWGPEGTQNLSLEEQYKSMDLTKIKEAIEYAHATNLYPIDLWGLEWWYYLKTKHNEKKIWEYLKEVFNNSKRTVKT